MKQFRWVSVSTLILLVLQLSTVFCQVWKLKRVHEWMESSPSTKFQLHLDPDDENIAYRFMEIPFGVELVIYNMNQKTVKSRTNITLFPIDVVSAGARNPYGFLLSNFNPVTRKLSVVGVQNNVVGFASLTTDGTLLRVGKSSRFPSVTGGGGACDAVWVDEDLFLYGGTVSGYQYKLLRFNSDFNLTFEAPLTNVWGTFRIQKHPTQNSVWFSYLSNKGVSVVTLDVRTNPLTSIGNIAFPGNSAWGRTYLEDDGKVVQYLTFFKESTVITARRYAAFPSMTIEADVSFNVTFYGFDTDTSHGYQVFTYRNETASMLSLATLAVGSIKFETIPILPADAISSNIMGIMKTKNTIFVNGVTTKPCLFNNSVPLPKGFIVIELAREWATPEPIIPVPTNPAVPLESSNMVIISVGAVVSFLFVIGIISVLYINIKRKQVKSDEKSTTSSSYDTCMSSVSSWSASSTQMVQANVYAIPGYLQVQLGEVVRLKQRIAVGGGGSVHLADIIDKRMIEKYGQKTAVVKLPLDETSQTLKQRDAFIQEVSVTAYLNEKSMHFAQLYGYDDRRLAIVMKLYPKGSLSAFINANKDGLSKHLVLRFISDVSLGIETMHLSGLVHCDLKSDNLLVDMDPKTESYRLVLTDFGISKLAMDRIVVPKNMPSSNLRGLTVSFSAPEALADFYSHQTDGKPMTVESLQCTDIYSLACVFYHVITQLKPWAKKEAPLMTMTQSQTRTQSPPLSQHSNVTSAQTRTK